MLLEMVSGLKKNKEAIIILIVGFFLATKVFDSVLDRFLPTKLELTGERAAPIIAELPTKSYVDVRISDLDKISEQRHKEAMSLLQNLTSRQSEQNHLIQKISDRVYDLAKSPGSRTRAEASRCLPNTLSAKASKRLGLECI